MSSTQEGLGAYTWLREQIRACYPEDAEALIATTKVKGGGSKYAGILAHIAQQRAGGPEVVEAFRLRRNAEVRERAWQHKRERLARMEAKMAELSRALGRGESDVRLSSLKSASDQLREAIAKHDAAMQQSEEAPG